MKGLGDFFKLGAGELVGQTGANMLRATFKGVVSLFSDAGLDLATKKIKKEVSDHLQIEEGRANLHGLLLSLKNEDEALYKRYLTHHRRYKQQGDDREDEFTAFVVLTLREARERTSGLLTNEARRAAAQQQPPQQPQGRRQRNNQPQVPQDPVIDESQVRAAELETLKEIIRLTPAKLRDHMQVMEKKLGKAVWAKAKRLAQNPIDRIHQLANQADNAVNAYAARRGYRL